jgi:hypothetical protein
MLLNEQSSTLAAPLGRQYQNLTAVPVPARQQVHGESSSIGDGGELLSESEPNLSGSRHREEVGFKRRRDLEGARSITAHEQLEPCTSMPRTGLDPNKDTASGSDLSRAWMETSAAAPAWDCGAFALPTKSPPRIALTLPPMQLPPVPLQPAAISSLWAGDNRIVHFSSQAECALRSLTPAVRMGYGGGAAGSLLPSLPSFMSGHNPTRALPGGAGDLCWGGWTSCSDSIRTGDWGQWAQGLLSPLVGSRPIPPAGRSDHVAAFGLPMAQPRAL